MGSDYPIPVASSEPTAKSKFWVGFAAGMGTMAVLMVGVIVIFTVLSTRPQLAVNVTVAEAVWINEPFIVRIETSNPHDEAVELDNIEMPNRVFEVFEVLSVSPAASPDSPVDSFGIQVWYFESMVQPGQTQTVELTFQPNKPGSHVLELAVCNSYESCSAVTLPIEVQELPLVERWQKESLGLEVGDFIKDWFTKHRK